MWKRIGVCLVFFGVVGSLYNWITLLKERERRLEAFVVFLKKALFAMQNEKVKVIPYLVGYHSEVVLLENTLHEIASRLETNTYPNGQMVWEEVFGEEEQNWNIDHEVFQLMVQAGNGFFGRSRAENVSFLEKSIRELETEQGKLKVKNVQERKVWLPVGMLGTVMLVILFL